jgi:hypothetical protein
MHVVITSVIVLMDFIRCDLKLKMVLRMGKGKLFLKA